MPSVLLTGGRTRKRKRGSRLKLPRLPRGRTRRPRAIAISSPVTASDAERAALQQLATRLQRGSQWTQWRSANSNTGGTVGLAARAAAQTGQPAVAHNPSTGTTSEATPMEIGGGRVARSRRGKRASASGTRRSRRLKGGFLPALIPIIAAAISAIPGIAGTAVGIANLQEQKRQFNKVHGNK